MPILQRSHGIPERRELLYYTFVLIKFSFSRSLWGRLVTLRACGRTYGRNRRHLRCRRADLEEEEGSGAAEGEEEEWEKRKRREEAQARVAGAGIIRAGK